MTKKDSITPRADKSERIFKTVVAGFIGKLSGVAALNKIVLRFYIL